MAFINFNGKILDEQTPILTADNRGLKFGDGLFETFKFKNGNLILIDEHLARLWQGMKLLQFEIPKLFNPDLLEEQILQLIKKNQYNNARIRLTIIRGSGGLYDALHHNPQFIIQTWPLPENNGKLNENGLHCCIYRDSFKVTDLFSNCKHNNFMVYAMGALYAKKMKCNDALILNQNKNISDSTIANLFLIKNDVIYTPSLSEGPVAGIMRDFVMKELRKAGYEVKEEIITEQMLIEADEVFLTNSMYNIRWIAEIENKSYQNKKILEIFYQLAKTNPSVFC